MTFERIKQDANSIIDLSFALNNLLAERSKLEGKVSQEKAADLEEKIDAVKSHIKTFLKSMNESLKKQEAELNG